MAGLHRTTGRWRLGLGLSLLTATLWGSLPVALKTLLTTMSPLTVTWYRYMISLALLTAILRWRGQLPAAAKLQAAKALLAGMAVGFLGNNILFLVGLSFVGPSAAQVVIQLAPVLLIGAGVAIFGEPFGGWQWTGVAILLGGMALFFHRGLAEAATSPGVLIIVAAAAFWAGSSMAQKQLLRDLPSLSVMWAAYGCGAVLLMPVASPMEARSLDTVGCFFLLYCALNGLVAYGSFAEAMAHWEVSRVSAVIATTPLFTPLFTELAARQWPDRIPHEGLDWLQLAGGTLVAGGSMMAALARTKSPSLTEFAEELNET